MSQCTPVQKKKTKKPVWQMCVNRYPTTATNPETSSRTGEISIRQGTNSQRRASGLFSGT
jgi:hypothetical protein